MLPRLVSNTVIVLALGVFAVGVPLDALSRVRTTVAGALATIGLCQPEWRLFGPNVHKENIELEAVVTLADGSTRRWSSPPFGTNRSLLHKFREGQFPKFFDNLRRDRNRAAWRPFAEWVAREVARDQAVQSVSLERRVSTVPPPTETPPPLATRRTTSHVYYERRFR